jgi:5'-methylthioadenosine phosphorylase
VRGPAEEGVQLPRHLLQGQRLLQDRQSHRLVEDVVQLVGVVRRRWLWLLSERRWIVVRIIVRRVDVEREQLDGELDLRLVVTDSPPGGRRADVGVYGGSGLYTLLDDVEEIVVDTPFGPPAAPITIGEVAGRRVAFLPRHGRDHTLPPHRVPYLANAWALRELGVRAIYGPCASGSLRAEMGPGDFVVPDQVVDRTAGRASSFHDGPDSPPGIAPVDHLTFADPYDDRLRTVAIAACRAEGVTVHEGGTIVVIEGPRFSTRAESRWYAAQGWEVINMTQMPEAALAAELGIPYATIALITDYDAGLEGQPGIEPVTMDEVMATLARNAEQVRKVLFRAIADLPVELFAG